MEVVIIPIVLFAIVFLVIAIAFLIALAVVIVYIGGAVIVGIGQIMQIVVVACKGLLTKVQPWGPQKQVTTLLLGVSVLATVFGVGRECAWQVNDLIHFTQMTTQEVPPQRFSIRTGTRLVKKPVGHSESR